jgi:hypothetical protein
LASRPRWFLSQLSTLIVNPKLPTAELFRLADKLTNSSGFGLYPDYSDEKALAHDFTNFFVNKTNNIVASLHKLPMNKQIQQFS